MPKTNQILKTKPNIKAVTTTPPATKPATRRSTTTKNKNAHKKNRNKKFRHAALPVCVPDQKIPHLWEISSFVVNYTPDETVRKGNASFTITNSLTGKTEELECSLRFNYLCEFLSTAGSRPGDSGSGGEGKEEGQGRNIWVQVNLLSASLTISESWDCDPGVDVGKGGYRVTGMVEVPLVCGEETLEEGRSCFGSGGGSEGGVAGGDGEIEEKKKGDVSSGVGVDGSGDKSDGALEKRGPVGASSPPYPVPESNKDSSEGKGFVLRNPILGMARRGRAMAAALAHHELHFSESSKAETEADGLKGETKMEIKDKKKKKKTEKKKEIKDKKDDKKEKKVEEMNEKRFIDQVEHRLCTPSCLREALPEPASGSRYTDGLKKGG